MSNKPFLITGHGRSGTKFISDILNNSTNYTVIHELEGDEKYVINPNVSKSLLNRFNEEKYGEVNSYLRYIGKEMSEKYNLNVLYILRSPIDIALSCSYRRKINKYSSEEIKNYLIMISNSVLEYITYIKNLNLEKSNIIIFDKITNNKKYFFKKMEQLGLEFTNIKYLNDNFYKKQNSSNKKARAISDVYNIESCKKISSAEKIYLDLVRKI